MVALFKLSALRPELAGQERRGPVAERYCGRYRHQTANEEPEIGRISLT